MKLGLKFATNTSKIVEEKIQQLLSIGKQKELKNSEKAIKQIKYKKFLPENLVKKIKKPIKRNLKEKKKKLSATVLIYNAKTKKTTEHKRRYKKSKIEIIREFWHFKIKLHKIAPNVFTLSSKRPILAINIDKQIVEKLKNVSRTKIKSFLNWYTSSKLYYNNHTEGSIRYNLDYSEAGKVSKKHALQKKNKVNLINILKKLKLYKDFKYKKQNKVVHKNQVQNVLILLKNKLKKNKLKRNKKTTIIREPEIEQLELVF